MARKTGAPEKKGGPPTIQNRRAFHDYFIEETFEAGIELRGAEVKSLRQGRANLADAHIRVIRGEAFVIGFNVTPYTHMNTHNPLDPTRTRRLLLHGKEIEKLAEGVERKGYTIVPLKLYFNARGYAKLTIGLAKGKQLHDKRETLKRKEAQREMERQVKR